MSEENGESQNEVITNDGVNDNAPLKSGEVQKAQEGYANDTETLNLELQDIKKELIADPSNILLKTKFRQLSGFIHNNGPTPDFLKQVNPIEGSTPYEPETLTEHEQYTPAQDASEFNTPINNVPDDFSSEDINDVKQLAANLELPKAIGDIVIERYMRHSADSEMHTPGEELGKLGEEKLTEFQEAAAKSFGSVEKLNQAGQKAVNYMRNVLSESEFKKYVSTYEGTSLQFDPYVLQKLAILHDQRGFNL